MATLAGEPLYRACGYEPGERLMDDRGGVGCRSCACARRSEATVLHIFIRFCYHRRPHLQLVRTCQPRWWGGIQFGKMTRPNLWT